MLLVMFCFGGFRVISLLGVVGFVFLKIVGFGVMVGVFGLFILLLVCGG